MRLDIAHHIRGGQTVGQCAGLTARDTRQQIGQGIHVDALVTAQIRSDGRFLGVVIDHVQPELGAIELLGDVAKGETELAVVARVVVLADGRHLERIAVGRRHAVGVQAGGLQGRLSNGLLPKRAVQAR